MRRRGMRSRLPPSGAQYTMEGGFLRMFRAQTFLNAPGYYEEAYADANYSAPCTP